MTIEALEAAWCVRLQQPASEYWSSTPARVIRFFEEQRGVERAADARAGVIAAVIANANGKRGARRFEPRDFFPSLGARAKQPQSLSQMRALFLAAAQRANAKE